MAPEPVLNNPAGFRTPHSVGNRIGRLLWGTCQAVLAVTPARLGWPLRRLVLRCFGARLGRCWIHSRVRIWAPWKLTIGDDSFVDRDCYLYNPWPITIGDRVVISFEAMLCTPTHDIESPTFDLVGRPIQVSDDAWICARASVAPGVTIGTGAVVGLGSVVTRDVPPWTVVAGNPARHINCRVIRDRSRC